jgi:nucleotide-binding universal stress UspA family protein
MTLWKRVLVPLDGSPHAEQALPVAARLARVAGATVLLAQVVRALPAYEAGRTPRATTMPAADPQERIQAHSYLGRAAKSAPLAGLMLHTLVEAGPVVPTLLRIATSLGVDLIVISSRGQTGGSPWGLSSVAHQLAREAAVPTLVLRASASGSAATTLSHHGGSVRALVPLDGSSHAETALAPAASIVTALSGPKGGALHLAAVAKSPAVVGQTQAYLRTMPQAFGAGALATLNLHVRWSVELHEDVAEALITTAEQGPPESAVNWTWAGGGSSAVDRGTGAIPRGAGGALAGGPAGACDVIVMAPRGPGGPQRWAMGSISERVLENTKLPVLLVRPSHVAAQQMATPRSQDEPMQDYVTKLLDLISA